MEMVNVNEQIQGKLETSNISFNVDVLKGLSARQKSISSKYLYDDRGSELFQEITKLDDYYLTKSELEVFRDRGAEIVNTLSVDEIDIVELGVGDGHKTKLLLNEMAKKNIHATFYPVDISRKALAQLRENIKENEHLEIIPIVGEYLAGLEYARKQSSKIILTLFLGSNIGNFFPQNRADFLADLRAKLRPGDLFLCGFDLKKNIKKLTKAYADSNGVTAKFNLNLLDRINRELGGDFDKSKFTHHAIYNPALGAMESFLISLEEQVVFIKEFNKKIFFDSYEAIHIEYSFKFSKREIELMATESGFNVLENFNDLTNGYVTSLWEVGDRLKTLH